ncbi:MAG TPA: non-ribosomal peptide synthetase [Blastocatellia bacterium]|nr:non-ribosomal peptide synthetase [Blastocatellia bacterium]
MSSTKETAQTGDRLENLEDLYPLSPMQQGMLFHTIYAPESGAYFEQSVFTIKGQLDVGAFERAWQHMVDRHSILRSSFLWEELEKPQQVVHRRVILQIEKQDWSNLSSQDQETQLAAYIVADRDRGFDLATPPLMRIVLFRLAGDLHRFLFSRHHLLLDRWSRSVVLKEVFALYEAFRKGEGLALPPLRPYGDYIAWLNEQDQRAAERYWRASLKGFVAPTALAIDWRLSNRSTPETDYGDERILLSEPSTEQLRAFAREHKLTLNILAQGAWALLLSRYTGEDDVVFGVTVAGRPAILPGVESMVGLFINTLPLRVRMPPHMPVLSWLKGLQAQQSELQQYEYSSLLDIQGWSGVPRGVPLFESIFVFENLPVGSTYQAANNTVEFRDDRGIGSTTGYPLTVLVNPGQRLGVQVVYDRARFDDEAIRRLLVHLQMLLERLPADAEAFVSRLSPLTHLEREQILVQWNDTDVPSAPVSVQKRFEAQVERTPDAAAVIFDDQQLSYRELNRRANQLAHHLRRLGVGADVKVGIGIDRSVEMVIGVLATLKAGGAYVPLDPEYPRERMQLMLDDARCPVLLTNERVFRTLPETESAVLWLDRDWDKFASESDDNPRNEIDGENLAYVIYTSGSTGQPKGVAMTERALANLLSWQLEHAGSFPAARTLQFTSLSFDVSFQEIFSTWCSGGTLLLISDELRRDALSLLRFLDEQKVERIFLPFVYLQHLAEAVEHGGTLPAHLSELITAGEQLEITPQIAKFCGRLKDCALHNHYGPSESHVVTAYSLSRSVSDWPALPPIGRPIANTRIYILDRNLEPTPVGVPGQLCIGGASLSRGYLNRPELAAEKFLPDPFANEPGARLYLTGDLARYHDDGNIQFLCRIDNQVKIRGFRVELGEIETMLAAHPSLREAVVVAREDAKGDRKLLGYVVAASNTNEGLTRELRAYLKERLPDYMIPEAFVTVAALPLTPSGKVNRRALSALDQNEGVPAHQYAAPRTPLEEKLAEIWAKVLRRERVGISDNFFELGGHSLLATQLISRVRSAFKVELPLRYLFECPTIEELAASILEFQQKAEAHLPKAITRNTQRDAQELLARIDQLTDEQVESLLKETLAESTRN